MYEISELLPFLSVPYFDVEEGCKVGGASLCCHGNVEEVEIQPKVVVPQSTVYTESDKCT